MTTITLPRATVEQALKVINDTAYGAPVFRQEVRDIITALRAALAQQAEPVEPRRWEGDHNVESPFNACMHKSYCITLKQALAQQAEPVCTDCRGLGYDSSGQLCGCQDKPSPCAYPNCVGGQAGTICKPSCPGGTK